MTDKRKYIKPKEYSEIVGLHYRTVVRKYKEGKIEGINDGPRIYLKNPNYKEEIKESDDIKVVLYARVSSTTNKASLDGQIERMRDYSAAKGYTVVREVKEIASGLNDERKKLDSILQSRDWDILLVEHKDRLTRFGFNYFNSMLNKNNQKVEAINNSIKKDKDEELVEDLVAIITSFAGRIYGKNRKKKTEKIIEELKDE
jgi:putative uncharacterized protein ST2468